MRHSILSITAKRGLLLGIALFLRFGSVCALDQVANTYPPVIQEWLVNGLVLSMQKVFGLRDQCVQVLQKLSDQRTGQRSQGMVALV